MHYNGIIAALLEGNMIQEAMEIFREALEAEQVPIESINNIFVVRIGVLCYPLIQARF